MGKSPPPKPYVPTVNFCRDCEYFQLKWKSEHSDWTYCDYWRKDTRDGAVGCDKYEKR